MWRIVVLTMAIVLSCASVTLADEVRDTLGRALSLYQQGKYSEAINELNFAISIIQDKQASKLTNVLPDPPAGWKAEPEETTKMPGGIMGGGVVISRTYENARGTTVTINLMTDSPAAGSIAMMASNPMFFGNNRAVRIKGNRAVEEWHPDTRSGQLSIIINDKSVITIEGTDLDDKEVLHEFANLIDFDRIKKHVSR